MDGENLKKKNQTAVWLQCIRSVAERPKAWVCRRSLIGILVSNPFEGMNVCLFGVLSGRGLCDELITCR